MNKHWNLSSLQLKGVKLKCYTESKVVWQANTVLKVNEDCLREGKYPNGKVLTQKDKEALTDEIQACRSILINTGIIDTQLKLL